MARCSVDHQVDGRRIPVEIEGVMHGDENELAPPDRLAELQVAASEDDLDMEVLLEPLDLLERALAGLHLFDALVFPASSSGESSGRTCASAIGSSRQRISK